MQTRPPPGSGAVVYGRYSSSTPSTISIEELLATIVRHIFEAANAGLSASGIAAELNRSGIRHLD